MTVNTILVSTGAAKAEESCIICLQNSPDTITFNGSCQCRPPVHTYCLAKWLVTNHNTCPICRTKYGARVAVRGPMSAAVGVSTAALGVSTAALGVSTAALGVGAANVDVGAAARETNDSCTSGCWCCCCSYMCILFILGVSGILR